MLGLATGITNTSYKWQPDRVGGDLKIWLRNNVAITTTRWDDSSGNGNHINQTSSGDQAALSDGGWDFEVSEADHYDISNDIVIAEQEAFMMFAVIKIESNDAQNNLLGTSDGNVFVEFQTAVRMRLKTAAGTDTIQYASGTFGTGSKMVIAVQRKSGDTGEWVVYKNGGDPLEEASVPSGDGNNTGAITFNVVGMRNDDRHFDGVIYEMLVYDTEDLTTSDIDKVNNYLKNKHGI